MENIEQLLSQSSVEPNIQQIAHKVITGQRLTEAEGVSLYECNNLALLGMLATLCKQRHSGNKVFFNRNFHIEPTNICIHTCIFCSYRRREGEEGVWDYSVDEMLDICRRYVGKGITEVHVVGGVHPTRDVYYYADLISKIKEILPQAHIKAFTAVELDYMIRRANLGLEEGLLVLKKSGLDSVPGGGAEIFDEVIRKQVCHQKSDAGQWLTIHKAAHQLGIPSNATMLYGHIENYAHRIDHLNRLRLLQDETKGFNAFIPLKYKQANNELGDNIREVSLVETLKNFAVCRIFLDNVPHIKAYWPMLGREIAQLALSFGADDLDGTIDDSTKIYTMAGADEKKPEMRSEEIVDLIKAGGYTAVERDSVYNELKVWG